MLILRKSQVRAYDRRNPITGQVVHVEEHSDSRTKKPEQLGLFRAPPESIPTPAKSGDAEQTAALRQSKKNAKDYRLAHRTGDRQEAGALRWTIERAIRTHGLDREAVFGPHAPESAPLTFAKEVAVAEEAIRYRTSTEVGMAWDRHGELVLQKMGTENSVPLDAADHAKISGAAIFIHNHPNQDTTGHTTFSPADIFFAAHPQINLMEVRALTPRQRVTMKPGPNGWPRLAAIRCELKRARRRVRRKRETSLANATQVKPVSGEIWKESHEIWKSVAQHFDWTYLVEGIMEQDSLLKSQAEGEEEFDIDGDYRAVIDGIARGDLKLDERRDHNPERKAKGEKPNADTP